MDIGLYYYMIDITNALDVAISIPGYMSTYTSRSNL